MYSRYTFSTLVLVISMSSVSCQTYWDALNLTEDLFRDYNKDLSPNLNRTTKLSVNITVYIYSIQEFDEISGKLSVVAVVGLTWYDELLRWNPSKYNGINEMAFLAENVWYPKLVIANPYDSFTIIGGDWGKVGYLHTGSASYLSGNVLRTTCSFNPEYFPFDEQKCKIVIIPLIPSYENFYLNCPSDELNFLMYSQNGEWDVIDSQAKCSKYSPSEFSLSLRRKPVYFVVILLVPTVFLGLLNPFVFLIPHHSGERVSYSITVLLAVVVFLTIVGNTLPKSSQNMARICFYIMYVLIASIIICVCNIVMLRIYNCGENIPVPLIISKITGFVSWISEMSSVTSCRRPSSKVSSGMDTVEELNPSLMQTPITTDKSDSHANQRFKQVNNNKLEIDGTSMITWNEVGRSFDKVCSVFFFFSFTFITVGCYISLLL